MAKALTATLADANELRPARIFSETYFKLLQNTQKAYRTTLGLGGL